MSANYILPIAAALLLSACASHTAIEETAYIAERFCLVNHQDTAEAQIERELFLSPSLAKIINDAQRRSNAFADANPGLKPPLGDGVHYQANVDHAPICKPGRMFTVNGVRYAEIHHGFDDPQNANAGWTDRLVLKKIGGKWMIDDVLFAPNYRTGMRSTLIRAQ